MIQVYINLSVISTNRANNCQKLSHLFVRGGLVDFSSLNKNLTKDLLRQSTLLCVIVIFFILFTKWTKFI